MADIRVDRATDADRFLATDKLVWFDTLSEESTDLHSFWDEHIELFRKTVLFAIRDTSDALLSPRITLRWRVELESQLEELVRYIELADRYIAKRFSCELPALEPPGSVTRIH